MCSCNHVFLRFLSCRNLLCSGMTLLPLFDCLVKVCTVLSFLPVSIGPSVILNKKTIQYVDTIQYIWNKNNDVHVPRGKNPYFNTRIHISSFDLDNYGSLKGPQLDIKLLHYTIYNIIYVANINEVLLARFKRIQPVWRKSYWSWMMI